LEFNISSPDICHIWLMNCMHQLVQPKSLTDLLATGYSTKEQGVFIGRGEAVELPWASGGLVRAPPDPPMHCLCIVGSWLPLQVGSYCSTCGNLVCRWLQHRLMVSKWMTIGPCIHSEWIMATAQTDMKWTLVMQCRRCPTDQWRGRGQGGAVRHHIGTGRRGSVGPVAPATSYCLHAAYFAPFSLFFLHSNKSHVQVEFH
jgi:hypothetical protein